MGGAVSGGNVYGTYPEIEPGNPLDVGRGRFIPTTSADEFYAELALWYGVGAGDLDFVLPNISRFYTMPDQAQRRLDSWSDSVPARYSLPAG